MKSKKEHSKQELLEQIATLTHKLSLAENLALELSSAKDGISTLKKEAKEHQQVLKELQMAELIVERSPVILFRRIAGNRVEGQDPKLEYISKNIEQLGYSPDDFLDGRIQYSDIVYPADHEPVKSAIHQYSEQNAEEYTMVYRCVTKTGKIRWVEDQTSVVRNKNGVKTHNQGILIDITERKEAEDALRKSEEKFRRIVETAAEGFVLMDQDFIIIDLNNTFCSMLGYSPEELLGKTPIDLAAGDFREYLKSNWHNLRKVKYRKIEGNLVTKDDRHIPVLIHGNVLRDDHENIIGNMSFVTDMTAHKKALVLAGEVQKSLLPQSNPVIKGLDIAGRNISCDEIGGDYFDFIWSQKPGTGSLSIIVGDISGHGIDSALLMTTARAFLRMRASQPGTISEIVSAMNRHLTKDVLDTGKFMTLFYLSLDPIVKSLEWIRAGHDPALIYTPSTNSFEELKGKGVALGVIDDIDYITNCRGSLTKGQIIAVGTDGIWEAFNNNDEMFGKERLKDVIRNNHKKSSDEILESVYQELKIFTRGRKNEDDITLVIIKVEE
ncbi:MAG: SpoIIE family protein phosphatase [Desulfotalea sp.]